MGTGKSGVYRVGWQAGDAEELPLQPNTLTLMADACKLGIQFSHLQGETLGSVFSWFSAEATGDEDRSHAHPCRTESHSNHTGL